MTTWIYFATAAKTSLASTVGLALSTQFLWRSSRNSKGALIANVGELAPGDHVLVAWRHPGGRRTAYLRCRVAQPHSPVMPGLVIDRLTGADARSLIAKGYPASDLDEVEGIRLDEIEECFFEVRGTYGGNNAIHRATPEDLEATNALTPIPPQELSENRGRSSQPKQTFHSPAATVVSAAVEDFKISAGGADRAFDVYVMVDWSANSRPTSGNDSIWIAMGVWSHHEFTVNEPINARTRMEGIAIVSEYLARWKAEGRRALVGFDFAFGYPAGFAKALGLNTSDGAWKALHGHLANHVTDSPENQHNRDAFAERCNIAIGAPGPFWGCARNAATAALTQHRVGVFTYPHRGLAEWRATDIEARMKATTQSVWKLNCGVSVGGQTILGIKHLHDLARNVGGHRWPFEGWGTPSEPGIWFAEIFPSLIYYREWADEYRARRDRTQVLSCVRRAAERDRDGALKADFDPPVQRLSATALAHVQDEEGWMLWV